MCVSGYMLLEIGVGRSDNDNKKDRVGDLSLGTVGNRKHIYFFVWPEKNLHQNVSNNRNDISECKTFAQSKERT